MDLDIETSINLEVISPRKEVANISIFKGFGTPSTLIDLPTTSSQHFDRKLSSRLYTYLVIYPYPGVEGQIYKC